MTIRQSFARFLRCMAQKLDGELYIPEGWNRAGVLAMNKYIGQTERYIVDLEDCLGKSVVARLRDAHGRFDTKRMIDAGAWKSIGDNAG